jgi:hypothetical protein
MSHTDTKSKNNMLQAFWEDTQKKVEGIFSLSLQELEEFLEKESQNLTYHI